MNYIRKKQVVKQYPQTYENLSAYVSFHTFFLKGEAFHTWSMSFTHQLVLFHTSCRHSSYLLVFIPIVTRFHTTSYIHTYILVLHTYTASYSLRLSFIPRRLFTLWLISSSYGGIGFNLSYCRRDWIILMHWVFILSAGLVAAWANCERGGSR